MRRDQLEVGLEREYALLAWTDGAVAHLLANDWLLDSFADHVDRPAWQRMRDAGWKLAPEYSKCLLEVSSPPVLREAWPELLAGFAQIEQWLSLAAERCGARSRFDRIACTPEFCLRTDRFVTWQGELVTSLDSILLDPSDNNLLLGTGRAPACLGGVPELAYAGFTSTNATVHPPIHVEPTAEQLARYYWRILFTARQIDVTHPQAHALLRDGRHPITPQPDRSIRDALIRWGDPSTAHLLEALSPDAGLEQFYQLFGQPPGPGFSTDLRPYSCRPRVVDNTMLFELRCFHSGLPLANLAPLLEVPL